MSKLSHAARELLKLSHTTFFTPYMIPSLLTDVARLPRSRILPDLEIPTNDDSFMFTRILLLQKTYFPITLDRFLKGNKITESSTSRGLNCTLEG
jgi:hypothetical protein